MAVAMAAAISGCMSAQVSFLRAQCRSIGDATDSPHSKLVEFVASFRTANLANEQLIYEVNLFNSRWQPIQSTDGRYENADGRVAANKAVMVLQSPWVFEGLSVAIPFDELEARRSDFPLLAEFTVHRPAGKVLARKFASVPLGALPDTGSMGDDDRSAGQRRRRSPASLPPEESAPPEPTYPNPRMPAGSADQPPVDSPEPERARTRAESGDPLPEAGTRETAPAEWRPNDAEAAAEFTLSGFTAPDSELLDEPPADSHPETPVRHSVVSDPGSTEAPADEPDVTPASPQPRPALTFTRYTVRNGDTLSGIALRMLGEASRWQEIYHLNAGSLESPNLIVEGMELLLPLETRESESGAPGAGAPAPATASAPARRQE